MQNKQPQAPNSQPDGVLRLQRGLGSLPYKPPIPALSPPPKIHSMNFKKLKRLLSIVLSATMILSSNMTGLAAEVTADPAAATEESQEPSEHEHEWQFVETLKDVDRYVCSIEGCTETKTMPHEDDADEEVETETDAAESDDPITEQQKPSESPAGNTNEAMAVDDVADTENPVTPTVGTCDNHSVVAVSRKAPTCLEPGMSAYYTCTACEVKYRTRADATAQTNPIPEDKEDEVLAIAKLDHRAVEVQEKKPTCTQDGNIHYYTCPLCEERYASIDALYDDTTEQRTNLNKEDTIKKATGHAYTESAKSTVEFNWDKFDFATYKAGEACGVTAKRTCVNENCDEDGGYVQQAKSVAVTKTAPDPDFDCTAGGESNTVTYTAVATFEDEDNNPSAAGTPTQEQEEKPLPVTDHAYTYAFTWGEGLLIMDEDGKLAYDTTKLTVVRICNICDKEPADAPEISVSVKLTEDEMSDEDYTLKCTAEGPYEFTATATVEGKVVKTEKQELTLPIGRHDLDFVDGKEPDCDNPGNFPYFICRNEGCGNKYWDEESAQNGDEPLTNKDIERAALGHNFGRPKFEFTQFPVAVAKFTCVRGDAIVTETCTVDRESGDWKEANPTAKCGDVVDITYDASVKFDGNTLKKDENGMLHNDPDAEGYAPMTYTGSVVQKDVTLKHEFKLVENSIQWVDTPEDGSYVDPTKGVKATLKCEQCQSQVVFTSVNGVTTVTPDENNATDVTTEIDTPVLSYTLNNNKSTAATCQDEGKLVYDITISGTAYATDTASSDIDIKDKELELTTEASGHKYIISEVEPGTADASGKPTISTMTIKCAVVGCDFTPISYSGSANNVTVTIAQETEEGKNNYKPATCTDDGNIVWVADITVTDENGKTGKAYLEYDTSWAGTPWTKAETDPAKGHIYGTPEFDWSEYGEVTEGSNGAKTIVPFDGDHNVYAVYTCTAENCTHVADASETPSVEGTTYDVVDNKRVKRVVADVKADEVTDCTSATSRTHTASVGSGESKVTDTATETISGHAWSELTWGEWSVDLTVPTIEVTLNDGKKKEIPNYTITASRTCKICGEEEKLTTTPDEDTGRFIRISPVTEAETCTTAGSTIYWTSAIMTPANEEDDITEVAEDCNTPYVHIYKATGHTYNINWTWYGKVKDSANAEDAITAANQANVLEYTRATVTKACANCTKIVGLDETYGIKGITFTAPTNEITCVNNDVFQYKASARFADDPGENGDVYSETRSVIRMKTGHDFKWELTNWKEIEGSNGTEGTVDVTGTCANNEDHTLSAKGVELKNIKIVETPITCVSGAGISVEGTFTVTDEDGVSYTGTGKYTHSDAAGDGTSHTYGKAEIDWNNAVLQELEASDYEDLELDPEKVVAYEVTATATCVHDEDHTKDVNVIATAPIGEIKAIDCSKDYTIHYTLKLEDEAEAEEAGIELAGTSKTISHTAGDHAMHRVAAVQADCMTAGHSAYYECNVCGRKYSNVSGTIDFTESTTEALGHRYENPVFIWTEEGVEVSAIFTCTRAGCKDSYVGHIRTFTATIDKTSQGTPEKFEEVKPGCVGNGETGLAYYMVSLDLSNLDDKALFAHTEYHGDVPVVLQPGAHDVGEDGICTICNKVVANLYSVTFKTFNGETFVEQWKDLTKGDDGNYITEPTVTVPTAPSRSGYTFKGWSLDGENVITGDVAIAIIADLKTEKNVVVTPIYEADAVEGTVVVKHVLETKDEAGEVTLTPIAQEENSTFPGTVGAYVDVEADTIEDLTFSYWADASGAKMSTSETYSVHLQTSTVTIQAVYVEDENEKEEETPTVVMSNKYGTKDPDNGVYTVTFVAAMNIPESYTPVESGILYSTNSEAGSSTAEMVVGSTNTKVKKTVFTDTDYKTNMLTLSVGSTSANWDKPVYARGYVICQAKDGSSSEQLIVYSAITSGSLNELTSSN